MKRQKKRKERIGLFSLLTAFLLFLLLTNQSSIIEKTPSNKILQTTEQSILIDKNSREVYVVQNGNVPLFTEEDATTQCFEYYSELDELGRCGVAFANIGLELMPTEERGEIGHIKPTGWHTVKYQGVVEGNYLYNRCHLIAYMLSAENANERNLITGTRYMNVEGMLPFEAMVADYVKETQNHVLYRVTPIYEGDNLVASGVTIEAKSVEDDGEGICFYVYVKNIQPGIKINYETGESCLDNVKEE